MYGREPLLPLQASTLAISTTLSPFTKDAQSYVSDMVRRMSEVFATVRLRQDRASRLNASRRDEDQNRYLVKYKAQDQVLIFQPGSQSTKLAQVRQIPPLDGVLVPRKWRMKWTGPHPVMYPKPNQENCYVIYHRDQRKLMTINVSDMRIFQPFSEIPFSGIPQLRRAPPKNVIRKHNPPLRLIKDQTQATTIQDGQLFLATTPFNGFEPISVMRLISKKPNNKILAQWMGAYKLIWHINTRLHKQRWEPGWFQPGTREFYFKPAPIHHTHVPFTNDLSEDEVSLSDIIAFNFQLRDDKRIPQEVARIGMRTYRSMVIPRITEKGPRTYEDPDEDEDDDEAPGTALKSFPTM